MIKNLAKYFYMFDIIIINTINSELDICSNSNETHNLKNVYPLNLVSSLPRTGTEKKYTITQIVG